MCFPVMTRPRADPVAGGPTILLCVGATKAGTTWLYNHLSAHPDCHLRAIKELHYFDTLESGAFERQLKVHTGFAQKLMRQVDKAKGASRDRALQKLADVNDWAEVLDRRCEDIPAYLAYLEGGRGARPVMADITPSYGMLPEARLRGMAGMAPDVRFLYLLRDPVSRLWSQVRMMAARAARAMDSVPDLAFAMLDDVLAGRRKGALERGDYAATLERLRAVAAPGRRLVLFQEELLSLPGLSRLCDWLDIRSAPADFGTRVLAGPELAMPEAQRARARSILRPQYEYVARHYAERLPASWRRNMGEDVT
ncbi:sulfotransferase [Szabonella alba]|uniref:Sulfotransferase n=1 Tax=Szabonella alba TaxID=2804194 RepID=A0A8K0V8M1_9RHOB|nr:sulfotransferase [Szabonella alba]MBL4917363.1 sulfotransferase [Szabonella alba]